MKKAAIILSFGILVFSCNKKDKSATTGVEENKTSDKQINKSENQSAEINWDQIPDLKDIGNFPFVTAPDNLQISNEKDGVSEVFDYQKMENYTGNGITTTEGKLGILNFEGSNGKDFNQIIFDKNIYAYLDKIGAKMLFKGEFPENENDRARLEKNMWNGKHRTSGLARESDSPFAVYAFKNNGKKYILNVQSNSAQGNVFIMEIKDLEMTVKKYSAEQIKTDIGTSGKAILNISFDTNKATLQTEGQKVVDEIYTFLSENHTITLSIEGHTDNTGNAQLNKKLSSDRANTVLYALAGSGIDTKRLKAVGYGSEKPLKPNDTDENKSQNRRVELVKL